MSHQLSFGIYKGKTYEWLFFHAPWYAEWIVDNGIHRQPHNFSEEQGNEFAELYWRASHLAGICPQCRERPIARMCLTSHYKTCATSFGGWWCDQCEYQGPSLPWYHTPSFFLNYRATNLNQLKITAAIKEQYIGPGSLTQAKMKAFFHTDGNFVDAETGFFKAGGGDG